MTTPLYPTNSLNFLQQIDNTLTNGRAENRTNGHAESSSSQATITLEIIIVGAGIGGLAAAVALSLYGHRVTILEQAPVIAEIGAGIQVPPNSARLLSAWGLGHTLDSVAERPDGIYFRRWEDGTPIGYTALDVDFRSRFHSSYYVVHRADLHNMLHHRAVELGVKVHLNSRIDKFDLGAPSVTTADSQHFTADIVVAADGINSRVRRIIDSTSEDSVPTGFAAYRVTAPVDRMREDPDIAWLTEKTNLNLWIGPGRHAMTYMISSGSLFNMVLAHREDSDPAGWAEQTDINEIKECFQGWDPRLLKVITLANKAQKWPLRAGGQQGRWISQSRKVVLLGDAAHAMLPFMSQGAAIAIEDAASLAASLHRAKSREDIGRVLENYENVRSLRSKQMQQASSINSELWHYADGPQQQQRDASMLGDVKGWPVKESANQWSDPVTQKWAYGYDAVASTVEGLEQG